MPGGLAESTGLLSVSDEVIEVNGIEVAGKTLDQVTDMMVANSSNLIITVKPSNQRYNLNRSTNVSGASGHSSVSGHMPKMVVSGEQSSSSNSRQQAHGNGLSGNKQMGGNGSSSNKGNFNLHSGRAELEFFFILDTCFQLARKH